ncbi:MAG: hypothetical protein IPG96_16480 [Proteobacteria bacterium]|nr:hypothetical protein [Pseudomonadota bacterium]
MRENERVTQADGLSALVAGKTVWRLYRRGCHELSIEFTDGTMLTIDAARAEIDLVPLPPREESIVVAW